jgi:hypothetical protein
VKAGQISPANSRHAQSSEAARPRTSPVAHRHVSIVPAQSHLPLPLALYVPCSPLCRSDCPGLAGWLVPVWGCGELRRDYLIAVSGAWCAVSPSHTHRGYPERVGVMIVHHRCQIPPPMVHDHGIPARAGCRPARAYPAETGTSGPHTPVPCPCRPWPGRRDEGKRAPARSS